MRLTDEIPEGCPLWLVMMDVELNASLNKKDLDNLVDLLITVTISKTIGQCYIFLSIRKKTISAVTGFFHKLKILLKVKLFYKTFSNFYRKI